MECQHKTKWIRVFNTMHILPDRHWTHTNYKIIPSVLSLCRRLDSCRRSGVTRFPSYALYTNTTAGALNKTNDFCLNTGEKNIAGPPFSWFPVRNQRWMREEYSKGHTEIQTSRCTNIYKEEDVCPVYNNELVCPTWTEFVGQIRMEGQERWGGGVCS